MSSEAMDDLARRLFTLALDSDQAGDLLACLFDGGSATIDAQTGRLVMVSGDLIDQLREESS